MPGTIVLSSLDQMTPTIWSHMRLCKLRGVLAYTHAAQAWVLHDPRVWLGTAFHRVMQAAARPGATADDFEMVWNAAIADAADAVAKHPLDFRFGSAELWPGYFLVRQRAMASALQVQAKARDRKFVKQNASVGVRGFERRVATQDGRLAGRPDFFNEYTIIEYKSSLPDRNWPRSTEILEEYNRQLRLYAAILVEMDNHWRVNARVVAASGQVRDFSLEPEECKAEAESALQSIADVNWEISRGTPPATLAKPDSVSCGRCPFKAICPAFWKWLAEGSFEDLPPTAAVEVISIELGHDADLYSAQIAVVASSHPIVQNQTIVLRRSVHGDLVESLKGAQWRIVSAKIRADSRLQANLSTVVLSEDSIPALTLATK